MIKVPVIKVGDILMCQTVDDTTYTAYWLVIDVITNCGVIEQELLFISSSDILEDRYTCEMKMFFNFRDFFISECDQFWSVV